jgi:hypothetical protein
MTCPRCAGCLARDWAFDLEEHGNVIELSRCINCGYIEDPVMVAHKAAPPPVPLEKRWRRKKRRLPALLT